RDASGARGAALVDGDVGVALHDADTVGGQIELFRHHDGPADVGALAHVDLADPGDRAAVLLDADIGRKLLRLERKARRQSGALRRDRERYRYDESTRSGECFATVDRDVHLVSPLSLSGALDGTQDAGVGRIPKEIAAPRANERAGLSNSCHTIPAALSRSDVNGTCRSLMPVASKIALASAAAVGRQVPSPAPTGGSSGRSISVMSIVSGASFMSRIG